MAYPAISTKRLPYDIDGTEVGYRYYMNAPSIQAAFNQGVNTWLTSTQKGNLNSINYTKLYGDLRYTNAFWFFFPEKVEFNYIAFVFSDMTGAATTSIQIQGSDDSTNGMDGTWETAVYTNPTLDNKKDAWRQYIAAVSFSKSIKVVRLAVSDSSANIVNIASIHLYGHKASGQTPDDIIFCNSSGTEYTTLKDWGDVPEGTTQIDSFYIKNVSTKQANNINIQLNHNDFTISTDQANWGSVIDIASLGAGQVSAPIYVKLKLNPPLLTLGPFAGRAIVSVGSWT